MSLLNWRSALADVVAGTANATILCVGDSLTAGCESTGNQMGSNARSGSWPAVMAGLFQSCAASNASWFGDADAPGDGFTLPQYDSRITMGSGWTATTNNVTVGHYAQSQQSGNTSALSFAPGVEFDRIRLYYATWDGSPEYTVNIGGGTLATLDMNRVGDDRTRYSDISCTLGTNTVNVVATGNYGSINGCVVWKSSVKQVNIINGGWWGATSGNYASNANGWQPIETLKEIAPDLTVVMLGGNDCLNSVSESTLKANLRTIVDAAKLSGDVLMVGFTRVNPTVVSEATQTTYIQYIKDIAIEKGVAFFDPTSRANWASYSAANSAGFKDADGIHNTAAGYADIAAAIRELVDLGSPQILLPASDIADGAWLPSSGSDLAPMLDASSASYIYTSAPSICEVALDVAGDPGVSTGHVLSYATPPGYGNVTVRLKQGSTVIAEFGPHAMTVVERVYEQTLTGPQADAITNYAQPLSIEFEATE